jgi:cell wall-associated NlpC family hydrolase
LSYDGYEGWIDNKQFQLIEKEDYKIYSSKKEQLCGDLVSFISDKDHKLQPIVMGSVLSAQSLLNHDFDGEVLIGQQQKNQLIETALLYLNTPYLWGGKTPFGIDCSGFTQMVYRLNGFKLLRDASQQATQGDALSFIEESTAGDLAFFDNNEGDIIHVGIIMENHHIIHAHGKVRIDRIDHTGIYNIDTKTHSHKLRVIKSIV